MILSVACSTSVRVYDSIAVEMGDGNAVSLASARSMKQRTDFVLDRMSDDCPSYGMLSDLNFDLSFLIYHKSKKRN